MLELGERRPVDKHQGVCYMLRGDEQRKQLRCAECGRESDDAAHGWRGYLGAEDFSEPDEVIVFCPDCAAREFDNAEQHDR